MKEAYWLTLPEVEKPTSRSWHLTGIFLLRHPKKLDGKKAKVTGKAIEDFVNNPMTWVKLDP